MSDNDKSLYKRIMIWVATLTAILSLIFGLQTLYTQWSTSTKAKEKVVSLLQSSQVLLDAKDYNQAWKTLCQADQQSVMQDEIDAAKIETAMLWLRNMHANKNVGTFSEQVERVLPTLTKATITAKNQYLADIYAHLGWADFLRLRDGNFGLDPGNYYEKALAADPSNTYANTMYGHWLYWKRKDIDLGWQHFQSAAMSGRDLEYTRHMQFAALRNFDAWNIDFLKLLNIMKLKGEAIEESVAINSLKVNYLGIGFRRFRVALQSGKPVETSITPEEDLALFKWLWQEHPNFVKGYSKYQPFVHAILTEAMGDNTAAAAMYTELYAGLPDSNPTVYQIDEYLQNAITRTSSNP